MKKNTVLVLLLTSLISVGMMASCGASISNIPNNTDSSIIMEDDKPSESFKTEESPSSETEVEGDAIGGTGDACKLHSWNYHSITGELISYVGSEAFEDWLNTVSGEEINVARFVKDFGIDSATFDNIVCVNIPEENLDGMTLDEYYTQWAYNQKMREAIFSNDGYEISKAFVNEYAVVAPDGQIYSLEWLAGHNAEDYLSYGLSANEIQTVVDHAIERDVSRYTTMAEQIELTLEQAYVLEEAALAAEKEGLAADSSEPAAEQEGLPAEDTLSEDGNTTE
ncbi:MAG: hypothetical protein HFE45_05915 [Oscillospiraceae bacterium]|nr:hypothetical protein [Oscillospiraceae bacterium]